MKIYFPQVTKENIYKKLEYGCVFSKFFSTIFALADTL